MVDFVEICNVCVRKVINEAAKRIINSDKVCHSYSDLNFGVTFFGTQCIYLQPMHHTSASVNVAYSFPPRLRFTQHLLPVSNFMQKLPNGPSQTFYHRHICGPARKD